MNDLTAVVFDHDTIEHLSIRITEHQHRGHDNRAIAVPITFDTGVLYGGACRLLGWSLLSPVGAFTGRLWDGGTNSGQNIGNIVVAALGAETRWLGDYGVPVASGLYGSGLGNAVGSVFIALPVTR